MKPTKSFVHCILVIFFVIFNPLAASEIYFDLVEVVPLYLPGIYNISQIRIAKYNRTTSVLNFDGDLLVKLSDDIEVDVSFYYNRLNNNQYNQMLMAIPKTKICSCLDKYYHFFMKDLKNTSNLPQLGSSKNICPIFPQVRNNSIICGNAYF